MFRSQLPNSTNSRSINYPCSCAILSWLRKLLNLELRFNNYRHIQFDLIKNCDQRFWTAINLTYSCCRFLSWENNASGSSTMRLSLRTLEINNLGWKTKDKKRQTLFLVERLAFITVRLLELGRRLSNRNVFEYKRFSVTKTVFHLLWRMHLAQKILRLRAKIKKERERKETSNISFESLRLRQRCGRRRKEELRIHTRIVNKLVVGSGKQTDKLQGSTLQPLKTFKPLKSSWPLRKQRSD